MFPSDGAGPVSTILAVDVETLEVSELELGRTHISIHEVLATDDAVYFTSRDDSDAYLITVIDADTLRVVAEHSFEEGADQIAASSGRIFVSTGILGDNLVVLDPESHEIIATVDLGSIIGQSIWAIDMAAWNDETVYVTTYERDLWVVDITARRVVGSIPDVFDQSRGGDMRVTDQGVFLADYQRQRLLVIGWREFEG